MEKTLYLSRLEPDLAAGLLVGCEHLDPTGLTTRADLSGLARAGECYAATAEGGQCVYVVEVRNGIAWVSAIKGVGAVPWAQVIPSVIEGQAKGLQAVAFQTARRGLVRRLQGKGYEVAGWIMRKNIQ